MMKRREFIAGLSGAAAWPVLARAQTERVRRVGVLISLSENDPMANAQFSEFTKRIAELGWIAGRNLQLDVRWAAGNIDQMRMLAKALVELQPDVILVVGTPGTAALQRETRTLPIVFATPADPVGDGFVASLARPGGNITGFTSQDSAMAGKWAELLVEIAPGIKRVAFIFNPETAAGGGSHFLTAFETAAQSAKVTPIAAPVRNDADIETIITSLGREGAGGLVVVPDGGFTLVHRAKIILLTAQNNVPALYPDAFFARDGGLLSYGPDRLDIVRRSVTYVDRILRGAKPADLPVQLPTKFEMALNLKTAKALGLAVPQSILLRADEVIE
jgi:putative tryptophan/tyrosine transport system substrate-binding protein